MQPISALAKRIHSFWPILFIASGSSQKPSQPLFERTNTLVRLVPAEVAEPTSLRARKGERFHLS
jgi:hypothetical protein